MVVSIIMYNCSIWDALALLFFLTTYLESVILGVELFHNNFCNPDTALHAVQKEYLKFDKYKVIIYYHYIITFGSLFFIQLNLLRYPQHSATMQLICNCMLAQKHM